jgi:hypothetical protein
MFVLLAAFPAGAQGVVDFNVNVTGICAPPYQLEDGTVIEPRCGQPGRQQNEPSCKSNPLNELNQMCAFNDYSLSDLPDEQGDTVIGFSETRDGRTFIRRLLTGTKKNFWNGQGFMADPTMLVSEGFAAVTSISGIRGGNSVMQIQRMMELNTETGFRHFSEAGQIDIARISGSNFIDKPDARLIPHPDGGKEELTMTLEDGRTVTRELSRVRIVVTFAVFNGSSQNIRTYVTYNDCFGAAGCWSNPTQISQTSGLDQGLSVANIGSKFLYVMRRFADDTETDSIVASVDNKAGAGNPGKVFDIGGDVPGDSPEICAFDQVTLPDPFITQNAVSFRTNDFPWVSATANEFVLVYAERPRDPATGECIDQGSRVMVRTSRNGTRWSAPVEVSPVAGHAFQFMQSIACNDEFCQALWYDTRNESLVFDATIGASVEQKHWEENPYVEDFDVFDQKMKKGLRFRRTADVYTTRINIDGNGDPVPNAQPERVSRYIVDNTGSEREVNLMNVQAFGGNTVSFNGDYISINELGSGNFFAAWTDWRRSRPQLGSAPFDTPAPYAVPKADDTTLTVDADIPQAEDAKSAPMPTSPGEPFTMPSLEAVAETSEEADAEPVEELVAETQNTSDRFLSAYMPRAEGLEDLNPSPDTCEPATDPADPNLKQYDARSKDSEIFGAVIEDRVRLVSPTTAKNYCTVVDPTTGNCLAGALLQRTFVLGINNDLEDDREFTLVIANQPGNLLKVGPGGDSEILANARASWRQLPFGPVFDPNCDPDSDPFCVPDVVETRVVPGQSFDYVTLFVVSQSNDAPVTVLAYDDTDTLVAEITVNGISASGDLVDPGVVADVRIEEVHNPLLIQPDWADLEINPLNPAYRNPAYRNPAYRNPAYRNPAYRNEAYSDSSLTDPEATQAETVYDYELRESTEMLNSSLRNPAYRNEAPDSFVDVTFGVEGDTNTISAFNADFAFAGSELSQLDTQVIAWNTNNVETLQDCDPGQITEDTVIAAVNNPDFEQLKVATIANNLDGSITFPAPVQGVTNVTLRIFGDFSTLQALVSEPAASCVPGGEDANGNGVLDPDEDTNGNGSLDPDCSSVLYTNLGYAIAAQAGNTADCNDPLNIENCQIIKDRTLVIKDVIPPSFDPKLVGGTTYSFDATGSDPDAAATIDLEAELGLMAYDNCDPLTQDCTGSEVEVTCYINDASGQTDMTGGLELPLGSSTAQCDTAPDSSPQGNINTWTGFVLIEDTEAPVIDIPATELIVAPDNPGGVVVNFLGEGIWDPTDPTIKISVSDNIFKEGYPYPELSCEPADGSTFPLNDAANPSTLVTCTAIDAGPCDPAASSSCVVDAEFPDGRNVTTETFSVIVRDSEAPVFTCVDGDGNPCDVLPPIEQEAEADKTPVTLITPLVSDPGNIDPDPAINAYLDANCQTPAPAEFPLGTTVITWCATDFAGNTSTIQQSIVITDNTPPVVTVSFPEGNSQDTNSLSGKNVSFDVTVDDIFPDAASVACETAPDSPVSSGDLFPVGYTTVTCYASDTSGNPGSGSATVEVVFQYAASGISGKTSGKTGSSFPLQWSWTDDSIIPITVPEQLLTIERGACPGNGIDAQYPGSSGLRQGSDGSYLYNLQAVDPETGEDLFAERPSTPYCFTVRLKTGEFQDLTIDLRP